MTASTMRTKNNPAVLILNDQGGSVMDTSEDVTACLRAQDHGHPPVICLNFQGSKSNNVCTEDGTSYSLNAMHGHDVHVICFEPGIAKREGSDSRFIPDICGTLRAEMGDNQPAVCYTMNERQISMMVRKNQANTIAATDYKGVQILCHEVKDEQREMPKSMGCSE